MGIEVELGTQGEKEAEKEGEIKEGEAAVGTNA